MVYAPVIIPTLCRSDHFIRCMESLKKNTWAKHTEVFVGLDYPSKDAHWNGYKIIKAYLDKPMPEFKAVHVFVREKNFGASANSVALQIDCAKSFDRFIYVEDDLELSPNFLQYMDLALDKYQDDPSVIAVTGYSYPVNWIASPGCTVVKENFAASAWGRGSWFSKWNAIKPFLGKNGLSKAFSSAYRSGKFDKMIDFAVKDYVELTSAGWCRPGAFLTSTSDLALRIYLAVKDAYFVMPLLTKVRNHGYDGSGLFCQRIEGDNSGSFCVDNYLFSGQPMDDSSDFRLIEDESFDLAANRELLNSFDSVSEEKMQVVRRKAKRIAGKGKYYGLFKRACRILTHR